MSIIPPASKPRRKSHAERAHDGPTLDLERYVPAFITFIANKLSNSATALYQERFGINVTEWRIMSLLAIEPGIAASRICQVIVAALDRERRLLSCLSREEQEVLIDLLRRLHNNLGAVTDNDP